MFIRTVVPKSFIETLFYVHYDSASVRMEVIAPVPYVVHESQRVPVVIYGIIAKRSVRKAQAIVVKVFKSLNLSDFYGRILLFVS